MRQHSIVQAAVLAAALGVLLPGSARAQTEEPKEALRREVARVLEKTLPNGSGEVVGRLGNIIPDGAISRGFNLGKLSQALFTRSVPNAAADCRSEKTPAKEPDEGLCVLDAGNRDSPTGAYTMLAFSKNIGQGTITYAQRAAFTPGADTSPSPVKLSDADAYKKALDFLELLGVPKSEIPRPPPGATHPLPVRSLGVGSEAEKGKESQRFAIQKVVALPRAFLVPGGLWRDPASGIDLTHVIAPGNALVVVGDNGVQFARVDGWSDAQMGKFDSKLAKSMAELRDEITDDLFNEGVRKAGSLSILIALRRAYPNPDDPNPPLCPVCGVLMPALKVIVSQVGREAVVTKEDNFVAPGLVREYDLVQQSEGQNAAR
jgi:hypothetical protein